MNRILCPNLHKDGDEDAEEFEPAPFDETLSGEMGRKFHNHDSLCHRWMTHLIKEWAITFTIRSEASESLFQLAALHRWLWSHCEDSSQMTAINFSFDIFSNHFPQITEIGKSISLNQFQCIIRSNINILIENPHTSAKLTELCETIPNYFVIQEFLWIWLALSVEEIFIVKLITMRKKTFDFTPQGSVYQCQNVCYLIVIVTPPVWSFHAPSENNTQIWQSNLRRTFWLADKKMLRVEINLWFFITCGSNSMWVDTGWRKTCLNRRSDCKM